MLLPASLHWYVDRHHLLRSDKLTDGIFYMKIFSAIAISKLFQRDYVFQVTPQTSGLYLYLLIIFGILILAAVALIFIKKRLDRVYWRLQNRVFDLFLTIGIIGWFFILFRYEQIPYLASRLMIWLILITFIIWGGWIAYYWIFDLPKEKMDAKIKYNYKKYLPQTAKRKIRGSGR